MEEAISRTLEQSNCTESHQERIDYLESELRGAREYAANAVAQLASFRRAVRATVIENIKDGTICRSGANEALEGWDMEPYSPRWNVRVQLDVMVTVDADDEDDARQAAYGAINVDSENNYYVEDTTVMHIEEADE